MSLPAPPPCGTPPWCFLGRAPKLHDVQSPAFRSNLRSCCAVFSWLLLSSFRPGTLNALGGNTPFQEKFLCLDEFFFPNIMLAFAWIFFSCSPQPRTLNLTGRQERSGRGG